MCYADTIMIDTFPTSVLRDRIDGLVIAIIAGIIKSYKVNVTDGYLYTFVQYE